ncbi:MAG: hypothetical protein IPF99_09915 [Deltaproteobacteria bacterium]|nr:hypothetical protein [Deltaproteobacteria bacterium]
MAVVVVAEGGTRVRRLARRGGRHVVARDREGEGELTRDEVEALAWGLGSATGDAGAQLGVLREERADHLHHDDHHRVEGGADELAPKPRLEADEIDVLGVQTRSAHGRSCA